jgi:hypothetical protein
MQNGRPVRSGTTQTSTKFEEILVGHGQTRTQTDARFCPSTSAHGPVDRETKPKQIISLLCPSLASFSHGGSHGYRRESSPGALPPSSSHGGSSPYVLVLFFIPAGVRRRRNELRDGRRNELHLSPRRHLSASKALPTRLGRHDAGLASIRQRCAAVPAAELWRVQAQARSMTAMAGGACGSSPSCASK